MKYFMFLLFVCQLSAFAKAEFRTGDVLLQPLNCYLCTMIEQEEESIYSHIGLVVVSESQEIMVIESYKKVSMVPLKEFLKKTESGQSILHLRSFESAAISGPALLANYFSSYDQLPYDSQFSLDDEKLYCSELVMKLLNPFLSVKIPTKKMHFQHNRAAWESYFRGNIPDGEEGIGPVDFLRSGLFFPVSDLQ